MQGGETMTNQFEPMALYRNRKSGRTSRNLRDVLPQTATVIRGYRCQPIRQGTGTLFKEVEFVAAQEALTDEQRDMMALPVGTLATDRTGLIAGMAEAVVGAIGARWVPGKLQLIFHSGGYDSRIMSAAIRLLYLKRGAEWLGEIRFVCIGNECDASANILRAEGWDGWDFIGIRDVTPVLSWVTDMRGAGRRLNGVSLQRLDYNWALIEYLQATGHITADDSRIQVLSGRNETLMGATMPEGNRLGWAWREAYDSHLSVSRYKTADVIFPFGAYEVVRLGLASSYRVDWSTPERDQRARYRHDIAAALCPALAGIPRTTLTIPELSTADVERMRLDYSRTWYGQLVWPAAMKHVTGKPLERHDWWGAWSAAALCEALIEEGRELNVD